MTYKVLYTDRVKSNFDQHVQYLIDQRVSPRVIERWYEPLFTRIDQLGDMPRMYAVDEFYSRLVGYEVRKLTYRNYVVRYRVEDTGRTVHVISFMHGARRLDT